MTKFSKATARPWHIKDMSTIAAEDGRVVALVFSEDGDKHRWYFECGRENEQLIVEAVNSYDRLLEIERLAEELADIAEFPMAWPIETLIEKADELKAKIKEGKP